MKKLLDSMSEEDMAVIKAEVEALGTLDLSTGLDGKLKSDEFWKVFELMVKLQIRFAHQITHKDAAQRR